MNYKICVENEAESEEAQCLFFELGYRWLGGHGSSYFKINDNFKYITAYMRGMSLAQGTNGDAKKEITMLQLRDMVVLKRNDISDATHENTVKQKLLKDSSGWYIFNTLLDVWEWNGEYLGYQPTELKPITKKPAMKEFLNKLEDGTHKLVLLDSVADGVDGLIEVPEGADTLAGDSSTRYFWKHGVDEKGNMIIGVGESLTRYSGWTDCEDSADEWLGQINCENSRILWQRETQSEALPFIDDEPKYDPEDIGIAKDYDLDELAKEYKLRDRYDGETDEEYRYMLKHCISRKEPSLNDQYAEIEKVRQSHRTASETADPTIKETLSQRQEQYGSFEDVATATQDLLKILEKTGLKSLPSMHKEALHMICSKMVRIVNGDHNFIESWHDIAGYATLMENELRVTDGATNSRLTYQKVINGKLQDI